MDQDLRLSQERGGTRRRQVEEEEGHTRGIILKIIIIIVVEGIKVESEEGPTPTVNLILKEEETTQEDDTDGKPYYSHIASETRELHLQKTITIENEVGTIGILKNKIIQMTIPTLAELLIQE